MRTLVIGDIHGGYRGLLQVLERSNFDNSKDQLICLGDYVDGWSESAQVVQKLIELQKESNNRHIFIRGNHDKWCEDWLIKGYKRPMWVVQGGQATIESYINTKHVVDDNHKDFFRKLHNYYIDDENRGFVHGGYKSKLGLGNEHYESDYYWDRDLWELAVNQHGKDMSDEDYDEFFRPNPVRMFKHKEVYIGHTSTLAYKCKPHLPEYHNLMQENKSGGITVPMNRCNMWNIDTGGGWFGKISVMDIDTKEVWQSDYLKELYPKEKGR